MKFYIASSSQPRANELRSRLEQIGHECTSRWILADKKFHLGLHAYSDIERRNLAVIDEEDVRKATDGLILIAESPGDFVPGGKHVETGIAIALGRRIYVLGHPENIFHWHPLVSVFREEGELFSNLGL